MHARRLLLGMLVATAIVAACGPDRPTAQAPDADEPAAAGSVTAFEGARLIVGDGSMPIDDAVFLVEDTRFSAVGRMGEVDIPAGATRVDLTGRVVMPAIIDTHTHLSREREALIDDLRRRAYFGVGAALSLGMDEGDAVFEVRDEVVEDAALYRTAGRGITTPEPGRSDIPHWVITEEEARAAVREEAALDVDIIKVWVDDRNGIYEKLSPELYAAVIDEAHQHGLRVTAHIFDLEDAKGLLRAGVDAFAHGIRDTDVDEEVIALFRERPEVILVPNFPDPGVARDLSWLRGHVPEELWQNLQQAIGTDRPQAQAAFGIQARNLERLAAEGVRIGHGTDGNRPWQPHLEMEAMVMAGMTPQEVIVAATRNSAELLGLDAGTIEAGSSADFMVLEADPLDDITHTRRIVDVYLRGARVDRDAIRASWVGQ